MENSLNMSHRERQIVPDRTWTYGGMVTLKAKTIPHPYPKKRNFKKEGWYPQGFHCNACWNCFLFIPLDLKSCEVINWLQIPVNSRCFRWWHFSLWTVSELDCYCCLFLDFFVIMITNMQMHSSTSLVVCVSAYVLKCIDCRYFLVWSLSHIDMTYIYIQVSDCRVHECYCT